MAKTTKSTASGKAKTNGKGNSRKQTRREAEAVLTTGALRKREKDQALPGMEDARIKPLDDIAASIAEVRAQMNEARTTESGYLQTALNLMRKHEKTAWRAHGVELVRVPGEEKLRVRTSAEKATAETEVDDDDDDDDLVADVFADDAGDPRA